MADAPSCEACQDKGRCCRAVRLGNHEMFKLSLTVADVEETLARRSAEPLPFRAMFRRTDGEWVWWCPNLRMDGTCGDYDNRPQTCRDYGIGEDPNCYYWEDPDG